MKSSHRLNQKVKESVPSSAEDLLHFLELKKQEVQKKYTRRMSTINGLIEIVNGELQKQRASSSESEGETT